MELLKRKPSSRLPETDVNYVMGHGGMSIEQMRKVDRVRHLAELVIPSIKKRNKEYFKDSIDFYHGVLNRDIGRFTEVLREKHNLQPGTSMELFLRGNECNTSAQGFRFSDITTRVTATTDQTDSSVEHTRWDFITTNDFNQTTSLISVESSAVNGETSLGLVSTVDPDTGAIYGIEEYNLEGQANLLKTVEHFFNGLSFAVEIAPEWVEITGPVDTPSSFGS